MIEVGKEKDSLFITVNDDPRAPMAKEIRVARRSFNNRINEISLKVLTLSDRLNEAEETIGKINDNLKSVDSLRADSLKKSGASLLDSIKAIRYLITGKPQELQGVGTIPQTTVSSVIGVVKRNVINKNAVPGPQEEKLYKDAADIVNDVLKKGNDFFEGRWRAYRNYYEATPVKLFKDYKPII